MECNIRKWRIADAADLATALNNKSIHNNLRDGLPFPYTEKDAKDFISTMLQADKNSTFAFAITVDDIAVGNISVSRKDNIHYCTAEMGYFVSEQFWGQGIGTSAIKNICRYIFEHTDIIRIFAEPFDYNIASCKVLEKNGFICEGILRQNAIKNGTVSDMKMYSLIKSDWDVK